MLTNTKIVCIISESEMCLLKKRNNTVKIHEQNLKNPFLHPIIQLIMNNYFKFQRDSFVSLHVSQLNPKHN